jgi:hypothetical protein
MRRFTQAMARLLFRTALVLSLLAFLAAVWVLLHIPREGYVARITPGAGLSFELFTCPVGTKFTLWRDPLKLELESKISGRALPYGKHWEIVDGVQMEIHEGDPSASLKHRAGFALLIEERPVARPVYKIVGVEQYDETSEGPQEDWALDDFNPEQGVTLLLAHWFVAALALILPAWALLRLARRDRRARRGSCMTCGYDLRGSKAQGRCLECARPVPESPAPPWWRSRAVAGVAAVVLAVFALAAVERTTWHAPRPVDQFPMWSERQPLRPEWKPAAAHARPDRMVQTHAHGHELNWPWHQAVWRREDAGEFVVVLRPSGADMAGMIYDVYVFDRSLTLVRHGNVHCSEQSEPYGLYEFFTRSMEIPAAYRDRWTLAVAMWHEEGKYDPSKPMRVVGWETPEAAEGEDELQYVQVEPVEWEDVAEEFQYGMGRLSDVEASELKIRRAEGGQ